MEGALRLAEYFRSHAERMAVHFPEADSPMGRLIRRVLRLLRAAEGEWVDRTGLHKKLGSHLPADALTQALSVLEGMGLAEHNIVSSPKGGAPRHDWRTIPPSEKTNKPKKP